MIHQMLSRPLAAVLSIEFPWNRAQKKSDGNAETNGFAIFAFLNRLQLSKKSETFRDGSDGYSGHLITYTRAADTGVSRSGTSVQKEHKPRRKIFVLWVHGPSIFGSNLEMNSSSVSPNHGGNPHTDLWLQKSAKHWKSMFLFGDTISHKTMRNRETRDFVWIRKGSRDHLGKYFPLHKGG